MSSVIPKVFLRDQANKAVDFVNDDMRVALFSGAFSECGLKYTVSYDDISANEVPEMYGYTTGGFVASGKTVTDDTIDDTVVYDMLDVSMTVTGGAFGPVRYGVLYDTTNDNHLVFVFDFEEDKMVNDGAQFKIQIDDKGLMKAAQLTSSTPIDNVGCSI